MGKIAKTEAEWRAELAPEVFRVARMKGTEPPFSGSLLENKRTGVYECACCGQPLFSSSTKFDSGSGWPSYWEPIQADGIQTELDLSHGMRRVEVLCNRCDAHLGHVFEDGPRPTGLRYCINSLSMNFVPEEETTNHSG
jgi:peptide-methionine (R)-S-oxide reductase